ncbi:MAG: SOS response-associated peptidase family protein [Planctomycetia bacterium]|nr:SOS response-associated peptidase family protein [Planctomycetia bacterium]
MPLTGWFENGIDKRQYALKLPEPLFCVAGLHNGRDSYTMLMTDANPAIERFHDRMPVILAKRHFDQWLIDGGTELLVPYTGEIQAVCVAEPRVKAVKEKSVPSDSQGELF